MKKLLLIIIAIILSGCQLFITEDKDTSLTISVSDSRNIEPDMEIVRYLITGSSGDNSFEESFNNGDLLLISSLDSGEWIINLKGYNTNDEIIGVASGEIILERDSSNSMELQLETPETTGSGELNLTLVIPENSYTNPVITAQCSDLEGNSFPISFTLSADKSRATYSNSEFPSGYYILNIILRDDYNNGYIDKKSGKTVVIRVVDDVVTSGTIDFSVEDRVVINSIAPEFLTSIDINITSPQSIALGETATFNATFPNGETGLNVTWFVNGVLKGSGTSVALGNSLIPGEYQVFCLVEKTNEIFATAQSKISVSSGAPAVPTLIKSQLTSHEKGYLRWGFASDDFTSSTDIEYKVVKAANDSLINTIALADAITGPDLLLDWSKGVNKTAEITVPNNSNLFFRLLVKDSEGNITLSDSFTLSSPVCVSTTGNDTTGDGSALTPYQTLAKAVDIAKSNNLNMVYVSGGTYDLSDTLIINEDISLIGGYSSDFSNRSYSYNSTIINSTANTPTASRATPIDSTNVSTIATILYTESVGRETVLEYFSINGPNFLPGPPAENHTTLLIHGSPTIRHNQIMDSGNPNSTRTSCIKIDGNNNRSYPGAPLLESNNLSVSNGEYGIETIDGGTIGVSGDIEILNNTFSFNKTQIKFISLSDDNIYITDNRFLNYSYTYGTGIEILNSFNKLYIDRNYFLMSNFNDVCIHESDVTADPNSVSGNTFEDPKTLYIDEGSISILQPDFSTTSISISSGDYQPLNYWGNIMEIGS